MYIQPLSTIAKQANVYLVNSILIRTNFVKSAFEGARLNRHVNLGIYFNKAKYDQYTEFKLNFNPCAYGMIYEESLLTCYGIK